MADEVEHEAFVDVTLDVDVWLKKHEEPMRARMKVRFFISNPPATIEDLTDVYANIILNAMDSRSTHIITMEDERDHKYLIELAQIQAFHVAAPDHMPAELAKETE